MSDIIERAETYMSYEHPRVGANRLVPQEIVKELVAELKAARTTPTQRGITGIINRTEQTMSAQRWAAEHSARGAPIGIVLYDDDDDLFTVKTKDGEWMVYSRDRYEPLRDPDIDGDRGDQIVGQLET